MAPLGYVITDAQGAGDRLLADVGATLTAEGWLLAGVVQVNTERAGITHCDMDLQVLGRDDVVRISQALGAAASGCRLDPDGLETAVGLVESTLTPLPRLLILNKFGNAEIEGRGFRALIGTALGQGVPVLLGVKRANLPGFGDFAGGLATRLPADPGAVLDWCHAQAAAPI